MAYRVAIDTNILVSASAFHGPEERLLLAGASGAFQLTIPEPVEHEARRVLGSDFPGAARAAVLDRFLGAGDILPAARESRWTTKAMELIRDPGDVKVLAALLADPPDFFVTGDKDFLVLDGRLPFRVLRTRAMLALLERR